MIGRRQGDRQVGAPASLPPVELHDVTDAGRLTSAVTERSDHHRIEPLCKRPQRAAVAVVVVVVAERAQSTMRRQVVEPVRPAVERAAAPGGSRDPPAPIYVGSVKMFPAAV